MKTSFVHIGGRQEVNPDEIMLLQADINYTVVFFKDGKKSIVATSLKNLESRFLPYNFFRTHKSFLVNLDYVKCFLKPQNQVQMIDDKRFGVPKVMVSRRKTTSLKKCLFAD